MSNYSKQYKKYYENLRENNTKGKRSVTYNSDDFMNIYGSTNKKKKKKESFFEGMVNIFIYQLVVVVLMLMSTFYFKYSPNNEAAKEYDNIKAVINDTTYNNDNKKKDISTVIKEVNNYIKTKLNEEKTNL